MCIFTVIFKLFTTFIMKLINLMIIFVMAFFLSCSNSASTESADRGYHVSVGDTVENIVFTFPDSSTVSLDDLKGKVVVLQFTASWCSVCRKEMPFLEKEVWQKNKNDDFLLIGVDFKQPMDTILAFTKHMKITYPMASDPDGDIFYKFSHKNTGVTRNVVIDKNGKIAYLTRLFNREEFDNMKRKIDELLK